MQALLEWGGDLYQQDKDGSSPLDYMSTGSPLVQIIQCYGKVCYYSDHVVLCNFTDGSSDVQQIPRKFIVTIVNLKSKLQFSRATLNYS